VGAADSSSALQSVLDQVAAPYLTDNTIEHGFVDDVNIVTEYISSETTQTPARCSPPHRQHLRQTTYAVVDGDTFGAIAQANGMTSSELQASTPAWTSTKSISARCSPSRKRCLPVRLYRRQGSYNQAIASPVEYVGTAPCTWANQGCHPGLRGRQERTADVTYVNGQESKREVLSATVVTEATATVIAKGTKEKPKTVATAASSTPSRLHHVLPLRLPLHLRLLLLPFRPRSGLPYGTSIKASDGGTVIFAGYSGNYGYLVKIDHGNGFVSYYGHCSSLWSPPATRSIRARSSPRWAPRPRHRQPLPLRLRLNGSTVNPLNTCKKTV
jgi:hypothetical protein